MDCDHTPLTCQLEELTRAVQEPSTIEVLALVISGFAAFGTLAIAGLNARLLWKQHELEKRMYDDTLRARRGEIASVLRNIAASILSSRAAGVAWESISQSENFDRLVQLSEAMGDRHLVLPSQEVIDVAQSGPLKRGDAADFSALHKRIAGLLDDWVEDPAAFARARAVRQDPKSL